MWKNSFYIMLFCILNCSSLLVQGEEIDDTDEDATSDSVANSKNCTCVPSNRCFDGVIVDGYQGSVNPKNSQDDDYNSPECKPNHVCLIMCASTRKVCGKRNPAGVTTIRGKVMTINDTGKTEFGEWPWQAAVLQELDNEHIFMCGGTLIDNRHVLTVAHCAEKYFEDNMTMIIRLGEWDTSSSEEFLPHVDYGVSRIIIHPAYRQSNLFNDIAIIMLNRDVYFMPHIDPVCLPKEDDYFVGQNCIVTGWGTNQYKNGNFSRILKQVSLPVISTRRCQKMLRKTRLGRFFRLHRDFMCAGGKQGLDACKGDGGGPLVCFNSDDNTYSVAGLVSWGIGCGHNRIPGVYVNVNVYLDWIAHITDSDFSDIGPLK